MPDPTICLEAKTFLRKANAVQCTVRLKQESTIALPSSEWRCHGIKN